LAVTIKDVAKLAGVSTATVSMVVNKKTERITDKTKNDVLKAVEKLGYKPNYNARSLVSSQSFTVGLIVPEITNPFFAEFARNLEKHLNHSGYITFLCNSGEDLALESRYIDELIGRSVDGLIICGLTEESKEKLPLLKKYDIPYLILDNRRVQNNFSIGIDDYSGGKLIAEHFLELNHEICAFVGDFSGYRNIYKRYEGFANILSKAEKEVIIFETDLTKEGGQKIAKKVFDSRATAVFCSNDLIAVGIYEQATVHNIELPKDLSIAGFDDISFAEILSPKLTTVKQPLGQMAEVAVTNLLKMIKHKDFSFEPKILPVELLVRDSTISI
jgi:LacI family transcriptional regulator